MINKTPVNYANHIASPLNEFMRTDLIRAKQSRLSKKCDIFATLIVIHHRLLQSLHFRKKTGFFAPKRLLEIAQKCNCTF